MENFAVSSRINYICIVLSQSKFVLSDLSIAMNLSKCENALYFLYNSKKVSYGSSYKDKYFLNSDISAYFTLFKSNFVNMTSDNYSQIKTTNLKVLLFIFASNTILIEHKIFNPRKETIQVAMSKLWPIHCIPSIQMYILSTKQILQSGLKVKAVLLSVISLVMLHY